MKYTFQIELLDSHARLLRAWASVGRSFDAIRRLADEFEPKNESQEDTLNTVYDIIRDLKAPFESLHYQIRDQLREAGVKPAFDNNTG